MMKRPPSKMFRKLVRHVAVALPREREPLDAVGVGVLRRGEPAAVERELAQHVVDGLLGDLAVALLADHLEAVEVRDGEQRVVVEHLLEVRHEPARRRSSSGGSRRRAGRTCRRAPCGRASSRPRSVSPRDPQQELEGRRGRELGRAAEAAPLPVERRRQVLERARRAAPRSSSPASSARLTSAERRMCSHQLLAGLADVLALVAPDARRSCRQHVAERAHARGAAPAGSTCRRRTACRSGVRKTVSGQPPLPVSAARPPCRSRRGRAAPRGRP